MILSKSLWLVGLAIIAGAVWGNSYYSDLGLLYRVLGVVALFSIGLFVLRFTEFGSMAFETIKQSMTEIKKVVWPNRTETTQTTLIVVGVVIIAALILWGLDSLFSFFLRKTFFTENGLNGRLGLY